MLIRPFEAADTPQVVALSMRAWEPVFSELKPAVQDYVYEAFYPNGWRARQQDEIRTLLETEPANVFVAVEDGVVAGFVGIRIHPEDMMGEVYILAVDPSHQRQGVATKLIDFAMDRMREAGMSIVMVETGDDPGHRFSRATYESVGFERWPVARYFRKL